MLSITDFPASNVFESSPHERTHVSQMDIMSLLDTAMVLDVVHVLSAISACRVWRWAKHNLQRGGFVLNSMNLHKDLQILGEDCISAHQQATKL